MGAFIARDATVDTTAACAGSHPPAHLPTKTTRTTRAAHANTPAHQHTSTPTPTHQPANQQMFVLTRAAKLSDSRMKPDVPSSCARGCAAAPCALRPAPCAFVCRPLVGRILGGVDKARHVESNCRAWDLATCDYGTRTSCHDCSGGLLALARDAAHHPVPPCLVFLCHLFFSSSSLPVCLSSLASRSTPTQWGSIRFHPPICTYAPWGGRTCK